MRLQSKLILAFLCASCMPLMAMGFIVFSILPEESLRLDVFNVVLLFGFIMIIGIVAFSIFIARVITKPLIALKEATVHIASFDPVVATSVGIDSDDEFGMLSQSFHSMHMTLQESHRALEEKVAARTKQLNDKLEKEKELMKFQEETKQAILNLMEDLDKSNKDLMKFRQAVDTVHDSVLITDTKGRILYVNRAWEMLTGYTLAEVHGKNPRFLKTDKTPKAVFEQLWHTVESGKAFETEEIVNRRKDGTEYVASVHVVPVVENKKIVFYVDLSQNISERKEVDRSRDEFLAIASHELRTPLVVIRGNASLMLHGVAGKIPVKGREMVRAIHGSTNRLIHLVNNFLDVSRMNLGKLVMNTQKVAMDTFCTKVLDEFQGMVPRKKIKLIHHPISGVWVKADPERLEQVLTNLISNSLRYTKAGTITVSHTKEGKMLQTIVSDTGIGIDVQKQQLLFVKFQSATGSMLTRASGSTGLGLFIAKALVEMMGGTLYLMKSTPGEGSTFAFTLPLWQRTS